MILTGKQIIKEVDSGKITITPFDVQCVTTNSYDLTLGKTLIIYKEDVLDPKKDNKYEEILIPDDGLTLPKNSFHLGASVERVGSTAYVPIIHAKSGIARLGLFVHITANLIDIGSCGVITFQLFTTLPVRVYPGMKIAQVTFWQPKGDIVLYQGKYQNSTGPRTSLEHLDS